GLPTDLAADPALLTDPLVREMAFQAAGLWGMKHRHHSYLPRSIGRLRHHAHLDPGCGPAVVRVRVRVATDEELAVDAEVRDGSGRLLQVLEDYRMVGHQPLRQGERLEPGRRRDIRRRSLDAAAVPFQLAACGLTPRQVLTAAEQAQLQRFRRPQ